MPIYEYACRSCEHRFETIQKAAEDPLRQCPECGRQTLKKLLSAPVFRLKGSGWYETDFKTGDKRNIGETGNGKAEDGAEAPADSPKSNGAESEQKSATDAKAPADDKPRPVASEKAKAPGDGGSPRSGKEPRPEGRGK